MEAVASFCVAPLTLALLRDPIAFFSAEHARQMALLGHLDRLAKAPAARGARFMASVLLRWMAEELALHVDDEEVSVYPRLRSHDGCGDVRTLLPAAAGTRGKGRDAASVHGDRG